MTTTEYAMNTSKTHMAVPPGETIKELLDRQNITRQELAKRMKVSDKRVDALLNGKTALTGELSKRLETLGVPAYFWEHLEENYRYKLRLVESENMFIASNTRLSELIRRIKERHGFNLSARICEYHREPDVPARSYWFCGSYERLRESILEIIMDCTTDGVHVTNDNWTCIFDYERLSGDKRVSIDKIGFKEYWDKNIVQNRGRMNEDG